MEQSLISRNPNVSAGIDIHCNLGWGSGRTQGGWRSESDAVVFGDVELVSGCCIENSVIFLVGCDY